MATEIAGMAVKAEPDGLMTPLAAVAVIKGLRDDGQVIYCPVRTSDLSIVEAIGMHEAASAMLKARLPGTR